MRYSYQTHLAKVETISRAYGSNAALINDEVKKYEVFSSVLVLVLGSKLGYPVACLGCIPICVAEHRVSRKNNLGLASTIDYPFCGPSLLYFSTK